MFERLLASGERFRKAQAAELAGKAANLRVALDARREALSALSKLASRILREARHPPSPDMLRRINTTLDALAAYGVHSDAPRAGFLTDDIDPPGFEALAALIPRGGGGKGRKEETRVLPFKAQTAARAAQRKGHAQRKTDPEEAAKLREAARAAAAKALRDAQDALKDAKTAAAQAEAALKKAAAQAKDADREKQEAETRFEKASAAADQARQDARRVAAQAEDAAQALEDAEQAVDKARHNLDTLS